MPRGSKLVSVSISTHLFVCMQVKRPLNPLIGEVLESSMFLSSLSLIHVEGRWLVIPRRAKNAGPELTPEMSISSDPHIALPPYKAWDPSPLRINYHFPRVLVPYTTDRLVYLNVLQQKSVDSVKGIANYF